MKLTTELVPASSWYNNVRKNVATQVWDRIRHRIYRKYNYKCGICGAKEKLNCHEIWEYDDENYIQKLVGFIALCNMCHFVKHLGFAEILARRGELDYNKVIVHFTRVNECSREVFGEYKEEVFDIWEERSNHEWCIYLDWLEKFLEENSNGYVFPGF